MYQRVAAQRWSKGFCVQAEKAMAKFTQQDHCLKSSLRVKPPREILSDVASFFIPNMLNDVLFLGRRQKKHCGFYCLSSTSFTQDLMSSHKICFNHLLQSERYKKILYFLFRAKLLVAREIKDPCELGNQQIKCCLSK